MELWDLAPQASMSSELPQTTLDSRHKTLVSQAIRNVLERLMGHRTTEDDPQAIVGDLGWGYPVVAEPTAEISQGNPSVSLPKRIPNPRCQPRAGPKLSPEGHFRVAAWCLWLVGVRLGCSSTPVEASRYF